MNYPAASRRGIKKPPHKAKMCAPRGGELNPKEINEFEYNTNKKLGNYYAKNIDHAYSGLQTECGFMVRIKEIVLLSAGVTNLKFNSSLTTFTVGIGVNL
jgi:hypothetical protein